MGIGAKTLAAAALCTSSFSFAQTNTHTSSHMAPDMVDGEVQVVDKKARNITLRHGEIRSVKMPAMTMVFSVKESVLLDTLKAGDKVRFKVEAVGGTPTVTVIELVK